MKHTRLKKYWYLILAKKLILFLLTFVITFTLFLIAIIGIMRDVVEYDEYIKPQVEQAIEKIN